MGPTDEFELEARRRGYRCIAGLDEAGRGPLAGPVVAAAVILPTRCRLVGVELIDDAETLPSFRHPPQAAYVLGPERGSLSRELIARWGKWRRLSDREALQAAEEWRRALAVRQSVSLVRIARHQVMNERGRRGCSLVGVVYDDEAARIYHTRSLMTEDLVHELLHVANPSWPEEIVVQQTGALLG